MHNEGKDADRSASASPIWAGVSGTVIRGYGGGIGHASPRSVRNCAMVPAICCRCSMSRLVGSTT
ncbi:MAG: hypothetical protein M3257_09095 [Actinomycetota bacterium]|nr:hypothetical protein [Actinomycetota bacterium]